MKTRRTFDLVAIGLGILAVAVAAYLTLIHYEEDLLVCSVLHGCKTVQSSPYAMIGPLPVALLGLLASLAMLGLAVWRMVSGGDRFLASAALIGMLLASLLYLGYLTYLEIFVIEAICQWCVAYLIVTAIWFGLEAWGMRSSLAPIDDDVDDES